MKLTAKVTRAAMAAALTFILAATAPAAAGAAALPSAGFGPEDGAPAFTAFSGTIINVSGHTADPSKKFVLGEGENGSLINFVLTANTYTAEGVELLKGEKVTGYYANNRPMTLIYPPQHDAVAFAPSNDGPPFTMLDRFDENLVSFSGDLKINISGSTEIVLQDGSEFALFGEQTMEQALANRILLVTYAAATRSIPAQANPIRIVVFFEPITPLAAGGEPFFTSFGRFDENLVSADGSLKLNISENTKVILEDGSDFMLFGDQTIEQALANRMMLVTYSASTRSIPAQTTPTLIIVFFETAVPPIAVLDPSDPALLRDDPAQDGQPVRDIHINFVVNGIEIDSAQVTEVKFRYQPGGSVVITMHLDVDLTETGLE